MKNLAQVRAASALKFAKSPVEKRGRDGGDAIKKVPPMIAANGLLAALAFALEEKKSDFQRPGFAAIFDAIAEHLQSTEIAITRDTRSGGELLKFLVEADSQVLKLATAEAMEWLSYARRFVRPE
jgi:CRISPR/Cas system CMR-associated protein Cmr5 small subunit